MRIPKKCPKCGCNKVHTETGTDITKRFEDGILTSTSYCPLPRRIFCDGCGYGWGVGENE